MTFFPKKLLWRKYGKPNSILLSALTRKKNTSKKVYLVSNEAQQTIAFLFLFLESIFLAVRFTASLTPILAALAVNRLAGV